MQRRRHRGGVLSPQFPILIAIFFATRFPASAQSGTYGSTIEAYQSAFSDQVNQAKAPNSRSVLAPLEPLPLDAPGQRITFRQSLHWFIANSFGPQHLAGGIFLSTFGTALDRPKEYEPHWGGFAKRYGILKTSIITGNAVEAGAGLILREDPRYFRAPDRPLKARIGNVVWLTIAARGGHRNLGPAYARYMAIAGNNFLSNTWRVHSEANARDALLRTSEGFAGRLAANAFEEFWPDFKKRVFHIRN